MTSLLEDHSIDIAAKLTDSDKESVGRAYRDGDTCGDVIIALMIISILINSVRLYLDHCKKEEFCKKALKPSLLTRINLRRTISKEIRSRDLGQKFSPSLLVNSVFEKASEIGTDEVAKLFEEKG